MNATAPTNLTANLQNWQQLAADLWSCYLTADRERQALLANYDSWCCFGDRKCRCDFRDFAGKEANERVEELDFECLALIRERNKVMRRIDRCRRVFAVCAMRPVRVPGVVEMREAA